MQVHRVERVAGRSSSAAVRREAGELWVVEVLLLWAQAQQHTSMVCSYSFASVRARGARRRGAVKGVHRGGVGIDIGAIVRVVAWCRHGIVFPRHRGVVRRKEFLFALSWR